MLLPDMISSNQSAFVKGRLLVENVMLATEFVKGFGTKSSHTRGALKVDLSKAFDTVKWEFIFGILEAADFPQRFISWIRECLSTTSFSVNLNGELCGHFPGSRGLRQGDPLSPSLFIIVMEVFGEILRSRYNNGRISYHSSCRSTKITHLSFADDVMVFFDGKPNSLRGITEVFQIFKSLSGLTLNMSKTTLFATGLSQADVHETQQQGYTMGQLPVRYLGLPLLSRRMRKMDYTPLIDSINRRLTHWATKSLSFSGRIMLIKSVIYSVVNFWMGAFMLPRGCLREITKLCAQFLWSGQLGKRGIHKVSWRVVCLPKNEGGIGLREFRSWNTALNLRLIWFLFTKESSLWVAWVKEHRLKRSNFWTATATSSASFNWRSLLSLRPLAKRLISCVVNNGQTASFWHDSWNVSGPLINVTGVDGPTKMGININATVSEAVVDGCWRLPGERTRFEGAAAMRATLVSARTPSQDYGHDRFYFGEGDSKTSHFSITKSWESLRSRDVIKDWASSIWFNRGLPKHAFLAWVITLDRLPLKTRLLHWGITSTTSCGICSNFDEDRDHLFLNCHYVLQVWKWLETKLNTRCCFLTWNALLAWLRQSTSKEDRILRIISAQAVLYTIWKERNERVHNNRQLTACATILKVDKLVRITLLSHLSKKRHQRLLSTWFKFL